TELSGYLFGSASCLCQCMLGSFSATMWLLYPFLHFLASSVGFFNLVRSLDRMRVYQRTLE
ncbi:MAG: hypothetical protein ABI234_05620, partial [Ktedonobacteraceae bacterium]